MSGVIQAKLDQLGLTLPEAIAPAANYVPYTVTGKTVIVSGMLPLSGGKPQFIGKLGADISLEQGQECAQLCGLNILAHMKNAAGGNLDNIARLLRMGIFVNSTPDFTDQPKVANGVSDLMVNLLGDAGKHARFAVGVAQLPFGVAVEVDATFELK